MTSDSIHCTEAKKTPKKRLRIHLTPKNRPTDSGEEANFSYDWVYLPLPGETALGSAEEQPNKG